MDIIILIISLSICCFWVGTDGRKFLTVVDIILRKSSTSSIACIFSIFAVYFMSLWRLGFDPWVGTIPWRRAWQPTPVFLPGESPWTEEPGGLQSMGLQRVGHD